MDRILNFLRFWQKFVLGSDGVVAVIILWCLACIYMLSEQTVRLAWLLPVVVMLSLGITLRRAFNAYKQANGLSNEVKPRVRFYQLWLPMACVVTLPLIIFSFRGHDTSMAHLILPVLFSILAITIVTVCLARLYQVRPFAVALVAVILCVVYVDALEAPLQRAAETINRQSGLARTGPALLLVLANLAIAAVAGKFARKQ